MSAPGPLRCPGSPGRLSTALLATVLAAGACAHGPAPAREAGGTASRTLSASASARTAGARGSAAHPPARQQGRSAGPTASRPALTTGWSLEVEPNDGMQAIYALMSAARHTLDMTMYELSDPEATGLLESDAARGVRVRVLLDADYVGTAVNARAYSALASHGVEVRWAYPSTIFHQKTITVDGRASVIMTLNLTSQYYATSRDFAVITTDSNDVAAIEAVFDEDWSASGPPAPAVGGAGLVWSPGSTAALVALIDSARRSLLVENEEMADPAVEAALQSSAARGVSVEVVMTYSSEWAGALGQLARAGVRVRTYPPDASVYIHAKVIVADGTSAFLGSQNFSVSSLEYNRELGLTTGVRAVVAGIARAVESDYAGATAFGAQPAAASRPNPGQTAPGAWCRASVAPADDGYAGDYDVSVSSDQPDSKATASDTTDSWSEFTDSAGTAEIRLYYTHPGESITVVVGTASCRASA